MHLPHLSGLRLLSQPILQTALAAATIIAAALVLAKRAETKLARVSTNPTHPRNLRRH